MHLPFDERLWDGVFVRRFRGILYSFGLVVYKRALAVFIGLKINFLNDTSQENIGGNRSSIAGLKGIIPVPATGPCITRSIIFLSLRRDGIDEF
jgi:hypothetical protein